MVDPTSPRHLASRCWSICQRESGTVGSRHAPILVSFGLVKAKAQACLGIRFDFINVIGRVPALRLWLKSRTYTRAGGTCGWQASQSTLHLTLPLRNDILAILHTQSNVDRESRSVQVIGMAITENPHAFLGRYHTDFTPLKYTTVD